MSSINSPVGEVSRIRIYPWPAKPILMTKVVRVDNTLVGEVGGRVFSNQIRANCWYALGSRFDNTFKALHKLGVLTKEQVDRHTAAVEEVNQRRAKKFATQQLEEAAATLNIKLTKAQQAKVNAALAARG